jgi:hypothetical protein
MASNSRKGKGTGGLKTLRARDRKYNSYLKKVNRLSNLERCKANRADNSEK